MVQPGRARAIRPTARTPAEQAMVPANSILISRRQPSQPKSASAPPGVRGARLPRSAMRSTRTWRYGSTRWRRRRVGCRCPAPDAADCHASGVFYGEAVLCLGIAGARELIEPRGNDRGRLRVSFRELRHGGADAAGQGVINSCRGSMCMMAAVLALAFCLLRRRAGVVLGAPARRR